MFLSILSENPASAISIGLCFAVFYFACSVMFRNNNDQRSDFYDYHRDGPVPTKDERPL